MNYVYYSLDDGTIAYLHACQKLSGKPLTSLTELVPGRISHLGQAEKNEIFVCGVEDSESICKLSWIHALELNGKTTCDWRFIKVQKDE